MSTTAATSNDTGAITPYVPTTGSGNAYGQAPTGSNTLTQNDFLNLLVTQLQNQDPTNPTSDEQFASQMAQFSSLTEMQDMNNTMSGMSSLQELSSGSALIGKTVTTDLTNAAGNPVSGVVSSLTLQNGNLMLDVGGQQVAYGDITGVQPPKS